MLSNSIKYHIGLRSMFVYSMTESIKVSAGVDVEQTSLSAPRTTHWVSLIGTLLIIRPSRRCRLRRWCRAVHRPVHPPTSLPVRHSSVSLAGTSFRLALRLSLNEYFQDRALRLLQLPEGAVMPWDVTDYRSSSSCQNLELSSAQHVVVFITGRRQRA